MMPNILYLDLGYKPFADSSLLLADEERND
jgi:hypothetical protein